MIEKVGFTGGSFPSKKGPYPSQKSKLGVLPKADPSFGKILISMALGYITSLGFLMILLMIALAAKLGLPGAMGDRLCGIVSILAYAQGPITTVFVTLSLVRQEDRSWRPSQ